MTTTNIDVVVIHKMPYQETNAILTIVSNTGIHKVMARGVLKQTSKNKIACEIGSIANFEVIEGKKFLQLRSAHLEESSLLKEYSGLLICQLICELSYRMQYDNYTVIKKALELANLHGLLYFLYSLTKENGVFFEVNHCVRSANTKTLVAISLEDGGLIAKDSTNSKDILLTKDELILLKVLPRVGNDTFAKYLLLDVNYKICEIYLDFIYRQFDVYSKIQRFLKEGE